MSGRLPVTGRQPLRGAATALVLAMWAYGTWLLLTWTGSAGQLGFGAALAVVVAAVLASLGPALPVWRVLHPRRLLGLVHLSAYVVSGIVRANLSLTRRIWSPSLPLRPGMVVVPTVAEGEGELAAVGVLSSLIVDNQLVDLAPSERLLQYHSVWVVSEDPDDNRRRINGRLEELIGRVGRR